MTTITRSLLAVAILFTVGITHPVPARRSGERVGGHGGEYRVRASDGWGR